MPKLIAMSDIYWTAGFLEGEGCFHLPDRMLVSASQKDPETLFRLRDLFGGTVKCIDRKHMIHMWYLCGGKVAALMMTMLSLMSKRRQKTIIASLNSWKQKRNRRARGSKLCMRGHLFFPDSRGNRCAVCAKALQKFRTDRWRMKSATLS